jgi:hypothetical protein
VIGGAVCPTAAVGGKRTSGGENGGPKSALYGPSVAVCRRRLYLTLAQISAESFLPAGNGERMANKLDIAGEQAHALFLRLD